MKRVIICLDGFFPRGDPGANRVFYLAKAIALNNIDVSIASLGKKGDELIQEGIYSGIKYYTYNLCDNYVFDYINKKFFSGFKVIKILEKFNLTNDDIILIYGSNNLFVRAIYNYSKRKNINKIILDVVEWHQSYEYTLGKYDFRYLSNCDTFYKMTKKVDKVIAISEEISNYYAKQNINVTIIPPLTDTQEQIFISKKDSKKIYINIIYPGKPFGKDDIVHMLQCMTALPEDIFNKMYFHMTGISKEQLTKYLKKNKYLIEKMGDHMVFHGWLEYDKLCDLLTEMDYFYIHRFDSQLTKANFPSKLPEILGYGIIPICNCIGDYYTYLSNNENALFFYDSKDEQEILIKAITMPDLQRENMRAKARKCAESKFDIQIWKDKIFDFIKNNYD